MITTKTELKDCIKLETDKYKASFPRRVLRYFRHDVDYYLCKYLKVLRTLEYYTNNSSSLINKLLREYYKFKWLRLCHQTGLLLYPNTVGEGVKLYQTVGGKTCVASHAKIGKNVSIRPGLILGYQGDSYKSTQAAPIVEDNVEFSWGVMAFGNKRIGRGALINANCVITSNIPPYAIVVGNPAKVVGFRLKPEEVVELEKSMYPEEERLPLALLEKNYDKYLVSRVDELKTITRI